MMNPRVKEVVSLPDFLLHITFTNGEQKVFDMKPYLDKGIFSELKNEDVFNSAKVDFGTISWSNSADLCPDTFYELSK
jgi:hypothetical protein